MKFGQQGDGVNQNADADKKQESVEDKIVRENHEQSAKAAESRAADNTGTAADPNVASGSSQSAPQDVKDAGEGNTSGKDVDPSRNGPDVTQERIDQSAALKPVEKSGYNTSEYQQPTANDLGVDATKGVPDYAEELAVQSAANSGATADSGQTTYTSHPILNLHIGPYQFANGTLVLNADQVGDFEKLLESLPLSESRNIGRLDMSRVDDIIKSRIPSATKQFDSSVGKEALRQLQMDNPKIGTQPIDGPFGFTNVGLTDGNTPHPLDVAGDDSNETKH